MAVIFCGTYIIQLLTWTGVGGLYEIQGTQARYFITLIALAPLHLVLIIMLLQMTK